MRRLARLSRLRARRKEEQKAIAYRLHALGWTQEEICPVIGTAQSNFKRDFLSQFPALETDVKKLLVDGHPHLDIANRLNLSPILVWHIALNCSRENTQDVFWAKFPDLEKSPKNLLEEGYSQLDVAHRLSMPLILVWAVDLGRSPIASFGWDGRRKRSGSLRITVNGTSVTLLHPWPRRPLRWWGIKPTHLNPSPGRCPPRAMMPKCLKYKIRIWAMMLKHFRISSPNGGFDPHVARGYWEGDVDTCLHTYS
jgi:hypothetical protein